MADRMKVCVLFGGVSTEHLISCRSAYSIMRALREAGHEVYPIGMTMEGEWLRFLASDDCLLGQGAWEAPARKALADAAPRMPEAKDLASPFAFLRYHCGGVRPDVVFPAVHGINCEDGVLQGFLEMCGIPYVGPGVLASAVGMDKSFSKMIFDAAGIPQVPSAVSRREAIRQDAAAEAERLEKALGFPMFLKPANGGSSVGTTKAETHEELLKALHMVSSFDEKVLAERFVRARELEVAVLGNEKPEPAGPGEIVKDSEVDYYDYETKYFKPGADVVIPAEVDEATAAKIRELALRAYKALGSAGLSRVDFFLEEGSGKIYLNEINTLPGFTSISLYPMAWEKAGLEMPELLTRLCRLAIERQAAEARRTKV